MNRIVLAVILANLLASGCKKNAPATVADSAPPPPTITPKESPRPNYPGPPPGGGISSGGAGSSSSGLMGGGGSGGAAQAVRKAARRTQALNELKNLGLFIQDLHDATGRMPTRDQIMQALKKDAPPIHQAIEEGSYILTGSMDVGGLWAYELDSDKLPGLALIGGVARRTTPDEIQPYLKK